MAVVLDGGIVDASTVFTVVFRRLVGFTFAWRRITAKIFEKAMIWMVRGMINFHTNINTA